MRNPFLFPAEGFKISIPVELPKILLPEPPADVLTTIMLSDTPNEWSAEAIEGTNRIQLMDSTLKIGIVGTPDQLKRTLKEMLAGLAPFDQGSDICDNPDCASCASVRG